MRAAASDGLHGPRRPLRLVLAALLLVFLFSADASSEDDPCVEDLSPGIGLRIADCGYQAPDPAICGPGDDDDDDDDDSSEDSPGDDDSAVAACEPQAVVDPSCIEVEFEVQSIGALFNSCPTGNHVFGSQGAWQDFLDSCGLLVDPIPDHDWTVQALIATIREDTGCSPLGRPLWLVQCDDGNHYGYGFRVCGDCQTRHSIAEFVTVQTFQLPVVVHDCLPDDMACP